jgi:hypothetical protein
MHLEEQAKIAYEKLQRALYGQNWSGETEELQAASYNR